MIFAGTVTWAARRYSSKKTKSEKPESSKPLLPVCVEHSSVERCAYASPAGISPGNTHQFALADFLNDPACSGRGYVRRLFAKISYCDANGSTYLTVEKGLWKDGSSNAYLGIGESKQLVLAIMDADGNALTVDHKVSENPYSEHYEEVYSPFQVALRGGPGSVLVRLTYSYEPESAFGAIPIAQGQAFRFKLIVGKQAQLEHVPD